MGKRAEVSLRIYMNVSWINIMYGLLASVWIY